MARRAPSASRSSVTDPAAAIEWVSASEIGAYAYCGRMFWLQRVRRVAPDAAGSRRLEAGTKGHAAHGRVVLRAQRAKRWGQRVLVATLLVALLLWALMRAARAWGAAGGLPAATPSSVPAPGGRP